QILLLEKRLQAQVSVRFALENALGGHKDMASETAFTVPKPAVELIKEIAVLELQVGYLEQHLLSLYRKAFDQQISSTKRDGALKSPPPPPRRRLDFSVSSKVEAAGKGGGGEEENSPLVQRSHSSLLQKNPHPEAGFGRAFHSQPLAMMEKRPSSNNVISLAEHLGARISDHLPETPNRISEEMVRSMCHIYFRLADPKPENQPSSSSPASSLSSSLSACSPKYQCESWSPGFRNDLCFDVRLDNPFHIQGLKDFSGPYSNMIEVKWIYRDHKKLGDVECLLEKFRSLVSRLEGVNPKKMTREEKLAFWINIHNALVMHAFLAYGIPQNNVRRIFLQMKAAYKVGSRVVSADVIQTSILGCRISRPGQWVRLLIPSKSKFKAADERQAYGIGRPEPLLYFALSSGSHSDPAVRVYNPNKVFQELEAAKEDYIRATFGIGKDHRIHLPKLAECFARDSGLCQGDVLDMIQQSVPDSLRKCIKKSQRALKNRRNIEWVPHNFGFRYLILKDLV
ncbi:hypothetical protein M569_02303, partial [Genlisea aurea]